jgi:hypothetical protein
MKIGITGTRSGMSLQQRTKVSEILNNLQDDGYELHHGDCVGVDDEVALIADRFGYTIVCHPPINDELRSYTKSDQTRSPKSYFARNRTIVEEVDLLLVVPYQMEHQNHGGTWYTHDYAVKIKKPFIVIYPDGSCTESVNYAAS